MATATKKIFNLPCGDTYKYVSCLGFLGGVPGLIYCVLQGIQFFHIKAKIYELRIARTSP